jgi:transcriptional regulator with XRE-family HTH domain
LAALMGVDQGMVSRYERGHQTLPRTPFLKAAEVFTVDAPEEPD